jgi:hypothetical protein
MTLATLARMRLPGMAAMIAAPAALLLSPGRAEAIFTYNIFDSGPDQVTLLGSGSISLQNLSSPGTIDCGANGKIQTNIATFCTGPGQSIPSYSVTGPASFPISPGFALGTSASGITTLIDGAVQRLAIAGSYVSGDPIVSSAIFNGVTVASLGFTTPGLIGTWQLVGTPGPDGQIDVVLGPPPATGVPGPLPLFGAAAAFGWSRSLRRRISTSGITSNA